MKVILMVVGVQERNHLTHTPPPPPPILPEDSGRMLREVRGRGCREQVERLWRSETSEGLMNTGASGVKVGGQ